MTQPFLRKVIRVRATDSPNVRYGLAELRAGKIPSNRVLVPGVLTYKEYEYRRRVWDKVRQCVGLDGEFWRGADLLFFPTEWLNLAEERARKLPRFRKAKGGGCDPGEGGANSSFAAVDEYGLIDLVSVKTPNTNDVVTIAMDFMARWDIPPERFCFDRGGGGKQHADRMRENRKYRAVRTVGFGEAISLEPKYGQHNVPARRETREERYQYKSRRVQMIGELSEAMDPTLPGVRFAIPDGSHGEPFAELRRQLAVIPKKMDAEGRVFTLPKSNPTDPDDPNTLVKLIGRSPDEMDAVILAYHGMTHRGSNPTVGAY